LPAKISAWPTGERLIQADEAFEAVNKIGMPEAQLILAYVVIYLSQSAKSRAVPNAMGKAKEAVYEFPNEAVPLHLRNAPTKLMKKIGYAKDYTWGENTSVQKELPFYQKNLALAANSTKNNH
jgi:putative ATPase